MLNLVLFGPPGAGKGTQAEFLIKSFGLDHLSTGDLLRSEFAAGTKLGLEAKGFMEKGELVPDSVVIGMIKSKLENNSDTKGFIFDGFPRTVDQAKALDEQNQSIIENRINVYNEKTLPLIQYYKPQNKHFGINGMGSIDDIAGRLKGVVEKL